MTRIPAFILTMAAISAASSGAAIAQTTSDEAADLVAVQVREQGHACAEPSSAVPDPGDTEVGERAWILTCADARYRVRLVPDMAATIEPMD